MLIENDYPYPNYKTCIVIYDSSSQRLNEDFDYINSSFNVTCCYEVKNGQSYYSQSQLYRDCIQNSNVDIVIMLSNVPYLASLITSNYLSSLSIVSELDMFRDIDSIPRCAFLEHSYITVNGVKEIEGYSIVFADTPII